MADFQRSLEPDKHVSQFRRISRKILSFSDFIRLVEDEKPAEEIRHAFDPERQAWPNGGDLCPDASDAAYLSQLNSVYYVLDKEEGSQSFRLRCHTNDINGASELHSATKLQIDRGSLRSTH